MATTAKKSSFKIAADTDSDNVRNARKTLRVLQHTAEDKENLVGRGTTNMVGKELLKITEAEAKRKKVIHQDQSVQVGGGIITAEDLTSESEPSSTYWRILAEKRGAALDDSLHENEKMQDQIEALTEQNQVQKEMLDESKHLVEILQEMIEDGETSREDNNADDK